MLKWYQNAYTINSTDLLFRLRLWYIKNDSPLHFAGKKRCLVWECTGTQVITKGHFNNLKTTWLKPFWKEEVELIFMCEPPRSTFPVNLNREWWAESSSEIYSLRYVTANDLITQLYGLFIMDQSVIYHTVMHFQLKKKKDLKKHAVIEQKCSTALCACLSWIQILTSK